MTITAAEALPLADACQTVPRPIAALAVNYPDKHQVPVHHHPRAQLVYSVTGVVTTTTATGTWVLPPLRALWMPAGVPHWLRTHGACAMRTLYIEPDAADHLPRSCSVVEVSPLLRVLIMEAMRVPRLYDVDGRDGMVMRLLLEEIRITPVPTLHLPMPVDEQLLAVCQGLIAEPHLETSLTGWAQEIAMNPKTFARKFVAETGITFGRWRQQAKLLASLPRLARGDPVLNIALDLGYAGPSAFTAMFRKALGITPSQYFVVHESSRMDTNGKQE